MGSKGNANFFANFYIMLNFGSLLLQLFVTPKIQNKIGVGGGLMILPFALIGGAGFASAAATAFSLSVLRVTEGGLRSSVHRSIWEQAFIPVDSSERSLVKIAVDGVGARIAEGHRRRGIVYLGATRRTRRKCQRAAGYPMDGLANFSNSDGLAFHHPAAARPGATNGTRRRDIGTGT